LSNYFRLHWKKYHFVLQAYYLTLWLLILSYCDIQLLCLWTLWLGRRWITARALRLKRQRTTATNAVARSPMNADGYGTVAWSG
jgi:hypothetical protein